MKKSDVESHNCGDIFRKIIEDLEERVRQLESIVSSLKVKRMGSQNISKETAIVPKSIATVEPISSTSVSSISSSFLEVGKGEKLTRIIVNIVERFKNFKFSQNLSKDEFVFSLLEHLTENRSIKSIIRNSGIELFIVDQIYRSLQTLQMKKTNLTLLLSLSALEYLSEFIL